MRVAPEQTSFTSPRGFIVVDGVNGAGKGTLIRSINDYIIHRGIPLLLTREPGGTPLGEAIRALLLENRAKSRKPMSETLLFIADRAEHVETVIKPALKKKQLVISDRFYYSTLAFQGYGRGLDLEVLEKMNLYAIDGCLPDCVIILDLDPKVGLERTQSRSSSEKDSFEQEKLQFHNKIRRGFLAMAEKLPEQFVVLDGSQKAEAVFTQAKVVIDRWLNQLELVAR